MLSENTKKDVKALAAIMMQLDNTGRTIMLSNATVLLARQEMNGGGTVGVTPMGQQEQGEGHQT
ncbi:MAG: hypothetical protein NC337_09350 [Roseburia sp.]|nr:hypothetical protein [Roseburia sp.]